jgi:hypothetical protein
LFRVLEERAAGDRGQPGSSESEGGGKLRAQRRRKIRQRSDRPREWLNGGFLRAGSEALAELRELVALGLLAAARLCGAVSQEARTWRAA